MLPDVTVPPEPGSADRGQEPGDGNIGRAAAAGGRRQGICSRVPAPVRTGMTLRIVTLAEEHAGNEWPI